MSNGLYLSMLDAIAPMNKGYAGDFRSGVMEDIVGPYHLRNYSVRELLNRFVGDSQGAFWVTTKPYLRRTRTSPAPQRFWTIIEYRDRPADVEWQLQNIEQTASAAFR